MHPKSVQTLVLWFLKYKMKITDRDLFQMAYFNVYGKAEPRCEWCFDLYKRKGVVPLFVRVFIQAHFVTKGQDNESQSAEGSRTPRKEVQLYRVR